jgi:hypothetical protein
MEQQSDRCVELGEGGLEYMYLFNPVTRRFLYNAKDLSAPPPLLHE